MIGDYKQNEMNSDNEEDYTDDDKNTISLHTDRNRRLMLNEINPSSYIPGINLDLSFAADGKQLYNSNNNINNDDDDLCSYNSHENNIQEEEVTVIFDLPDGSQGEHKFKLGQTVEVLKSFVESEYGIPMMEQELFLEDKLMLNPFSLLDYPDAKGTDEIFVRVEGNLPSYSKK